MKLILHIAPYIIGVTYEATWLVHLVFSYSINIFLHANRPIHSSEHPVHQYNHDWHVDTQMAHLSFQRHVKATFRPPSAGGSDVT